jgi:hypothetical protein
LYRDGIPQFLIAIGLVQDRAGLMLQGLDLVGDHLELGAYPGIEHLIRLVDFPGQIHQIGDRGQTAHRVRGTAVRPGVLIALIFLGFALHRFPLTLPDRPRACGNHTLCNSLPDISYYIFILLLFKCNPIS